MWRNKMNGNELQKEISALEVVLLNLEEKKKEIKKDLKERIKLYREMLPNGNHSIDEFD